MKASDQLTPPEFQSGKAGLDLFTYVGSQAPIQYVFTATDRASVDPVPYQIDHKPDGAAFDMNTGVFSWKPEQVGTYSFVVGASDGTSILTKPVNIIVSKDRQSALEAVIEPYQETTKYLSASLDRFLSMYDEVKNAVSSASDDVFHAKAG